MAAPQPTPSASGSAGRPRRPELTRDPAPLRAVRPPVAVRRLFLAWTVALLASFLGLLGGVLFVSDARRQLLEGPAVGDQAAFGQAVVYLHFGALASLAVLLVVELVAVRAFRTRRRGRILGTVVGVGHGAAAPLLSEVIAGPGIVGVVIAALIIGGGVLAALSALALWLSAISRWKRA